MRFTQEEIVDLILNGPRSRSGNSDDFDELVENYMETFTSNMNDDDSDLAYGFSDWISDIYYESWKKFHINLVDNMKWYKESTIQYPSLTNITTTRLKRNYSEEEDVKILKFLIKHRMFSQTKDDKLWSVMEEQNVILRRSGQSMKDRFNKKISPNITLKLFCAIYIELL